MRLMRTSQVRWIGLASIHSMHRETPFLCQFGRRLVEVVFLIFSH
jgi:hypothetical protein